MLCPICHAFNCDVSLDREYCESIESSANITEQERDLLFSTLIYPYNDFPNHNFIRAYNLNISVTTPPYNTTLYNSVQIRNAWLSFLAVFPSVIENRTLFVPPLTNTLSKHNHSVYIPPNYQSSGYPTTSEGDCKRTYGLVLNNATVNYYLNGAYKSTGDFSPVAISSRGYLRSELTINTRLQVDHYRWERYCCKTYKGKCKKYCYRCVYSHTTYEPDKVVITENKDVELYTAVPRTGIVITNRYLNTTKGNFSASDYSFFRLGFNESYITRQTYYYDIVFDKKPYYYAYLEAHNFSRSTQKNIRLANDTFFVKNPLNCSLFAYNHFNNISSGCNTSLLQEPPPEKLERTTAKADLSLLIHTILFVLVLYIIYRLVKSQARKKALPVIILLLILAPAALAQEAEEECGITNLASCLPAKAYEYLLFIINLPILPILEAIKHLLTAEVSTDIFYHTWSIIRYILGFFYIFFFLYAGYIFLTSNANPIKRAHAKELLKDTVLMIVLIQGSYYLYGLVLSLSSVMDSAILSMIDPHFFMITADSVTNIALEFLFITTYVMSLFLTLLMLVLRYIVVSFGVVILPIGLFCYFTPPLRGYGRFILNVLGIFIFITFIDLLIILACAMLIENSLFENIKIIVMINCFGIINYSLWLAIKFALSKSSMGGVKDDIQQAAKYIAMLA